MAVEAIAADPQPGQAIDAVRQGYRRYRVGSHVLFYRCVGDGVDIVRILHERMDIERHL